MTAPPATNTPRVFALVVAAGAGRRARGDGPDEPPKQFRNLAGRSVLARSILPFLRCPHVAGVLVVINPDDRSRYDEVVTELASPDRLLPPAQGGPTRQATVLLGLEALERFAPEMVLVHDAARPFVTPVIISDVIEALGRSVAVVPAAASQDTILLGTADKTLEATLDRGRIWRAQTPQGFHYGPLLAAHRAARTANGPEFTDDSSLMAAAGHTVGIVAADPGNTKLTTPEDFEMAEKRLGASSLPDVRVGHGFDVHKFIAGDHVWLCGVNVPHDHAVDAHSDGDVALHALTDAILGALADGDIGQHFRNTDPRWRGAASSLFLADAARRAQERGARITHVDVTVLAEAPKIGPFRAAMRRRIAELLKIDEDRIGLKATTTETLGFVGRRDGLAAMATATLVFPTGAD
ncbi:MAG TPA: bifunctional 2-C-methyl-D-erythritol 4-phosphate cytidylyltransferase/2-C-methyl-D-erythritol 2,4-cyclodiphosphate synthase [Hyphomicrobiaceae bacterium]|nr:bifunctional 2-C-methyl-D-erythritol 4-phosphate cytidylyltransferase/2-C-methyl-D-erythritol 2,4-cyclodiphosphate synthase [Hyphomicrobiaceae bacterium]